MSLTPADLEWIRRLPNMPDVSARARLRGLRRRVTRSDEVALLDSLLEGDRRTAARRLERTTLRRRLAVVEQALEDAGRDRAHLHLAVGARRLAAHAVRNGRETLMGASETAEQRTSSVILTRLQSLKLERGVLRKQLRELGDED